MDVDMFNVDARDPFLTKWFDMENIIICNEQDMTLLRQNTLPDVLLPIIIGVKVKKEKRYGKQKQDVGYNTGLLENQQDSTKSKNCNLATYCIYL
mmetsp:Transcript_29817/g.33253  ORF Transcript_29817/g.33253 Transcript_29817/m.33253 type:complete len:95 (-) Transcript_29817:34-318(-)